ITRLAPLRRNLAVRGGRRSTPRRAGREQRPTGGAQCVRRLVVRAAKRAVQKSELFEPAQQFPCVVDPSAQSVRHFADRKRVAGRERGVQLQYSKLRRRQLEFAHLGGLLGWPTR